MNGSSKKSRLQHHHLLSKRVLGKMAERGVALRLWLQGWEILSRNLQTPHAEIDLLCDDGYGWVIVEVKYRSSMRGDPISREQRSRLCRAATFVLGRIPPGDPRKNRGIRLDLILISRMGWRFRWLHFRGWGAIDYGSSAGSGRQAPGDSSSR